MDHHWSASSIQVICRKVAEQLRISVLLSALEATISGMVWLAKDLLEADLFGEETLVQGLKTPSGWQ
ncbi:hypothetical protein Y1Q_0022416 [Alligator mississippiensis]|uniref:Uncharacterized protein n=1 Tax=Alligator mississippiensis TaxID=8496 RepID=A0A151N0J6_ALLMI|nr:hypothetical protein Y1Q_0022416 [Alligator mississippiensis]